MSKSRTIYDKIWDDHLVNTNDDGTSLIYIDEAFGPRGDFTTSI